MKISIVRPVQTVSVAFKLLKRRVTQAIKPNKAVIESA